MRQYYSPGKVLDLSFPLPGAGVTVQRENLTSLDLASFLCGLVYCVGWEAEREEAAVPPLPPSLAPVVTSSVEALRCSGLHGLDVNLTLKLGKTFESLSLESGAVTDGDTAAAAIVTSLEARASLYYSA